MKAPSLTARVLIALLLGLAAGLVVSAVHSATLNAVVRIVEPIGTIWVNTIRMTVVPLVVSLLITGIASSTDTGVVRAIGVRAFASFAGLLLMTAVLALVVVPSLFTWLHVDPAAAAALRASAAHDLPASTAVPSFAEWLVSIVPTNPVRSAADGAMLPLVVFTIAFGLALHTLPAERREVVVAFFRAVGDAMLAIVRLVIELAPIGVFALMLPVASTMGASAAGALGYYVIAIAVANVVVLVCLYPVTSLVGRVPTRRFARGVFPAQAVAVSSSSSLASLPALIDGAERRLGLPPATVGVVLPLAVSTFKIGTPVMWAAAAIFLSKFYGVPLAFPQLVVIAMTAILTSFSTPGVPHGWLLVITPLLAASGIPVEGIGLLIAVDAIPDIFATVINVTGDMTAATIVARGQATSG